MAARKLAVDWELTEDDQATNATVNEIRLQRVPRSQATALAPEIVNSQAGVIVEFQRRIEVDGRQIDVVGDGGSFEVRLNNDGSFVGARKTWRKRVRPGEERRRVPVTPLKDALAKAQAQLSADETSISCWRFGYREDGSAAEQHELRPVYHFFVDSTKSGQPARILEVPATNVE